MNDPRTALRNTESHPIERSGATPITITNPSEDDTVTFSEEEVTVIVGDERTIVVTETTTIEVIENE